MVHGNVWQLVYTPVTWFPRLANRMSGTRDALNVGTVSQALAVLKKPTTSGIPCNKRCGW